MKKIFSFLCLIAAIVVAMSACSSTKEEKGTSETGNAAYHYPTVSKVS